MDRYTPEFKTKVVLEALCSVDTDTSIAQAYGVHPVTLSRWKTHFMRHAASIFGDAGEEKSTKQELEEATQRIAELERSVARLQDLVEHEVSIDAKMKAVEAHREELGLNRACELFQLPKSTYYYRLGS